MPEQLPPIDVIQAGLGGLTNDCFRRIAASHGSGLNLVAVAAARSDHHGKPLGVVDPDCPPGLREVPIVSLDDAAQIEAPVVYSGLDGEPAAKYEDQLAKGRTLVTNAGINRMRADVALFNPYIGGGQLEELYYGDQDRVGNIIAVGNCMTVIEAVALAPIIKEIGVKSVESVTLQGWSGAGQTVVPNDRPKIAEILGDEKEKQETELNKFFGSMRDPAGMQLTAHPNRGPWVYGHHAIMEVDLRQSSSRNEIEGLWHEFSAPAVLRGLQYANKYRPRSHPISVSHRQSLLRFDSEGMIDGLIKKPDPMRVRAALTGIDESGEKATVQVIGHNLILGAGGSGVANIKYARRMGFIAE